jgi:hypothetical protein
MRKSAPLHPPSRPTDAADFDGLRGAQRACDVAGVDLHAHAQEVADLIIVPTDEHT